MSDYHGKLLHFPSLKDSVAIKNFITALPQRSDFIVQDTALAEQIKQKKPVHFLPNDIIDIHHSDADYLEYKLLMIGILRDGTKAAVVLDTIEPFFELRVPADTTAWEFDARVAEIIIQEKFWCTRREIIQHYHFKYFNEKPDNYVRLYFRTIAARSKCLTYFSRNFVELRTETCADDRSCYYRKVAREYKFALCDWNEISDYDLVRNDTFVRERCCPYTFKLKVGNIKSAKTAGFDFTADPIKYRDYLRDKSLEMSWDLETNTDIQTGNAPLPENVFSYPNGQTRNKRGRILVKEEDTIFMAACAFCWYHEKDPFLIVNFTDMPTQLRQDCLIIQCRDQVDIILIKSLLVERMCPEFVVAFNDGMYDWPFILRRAEKYDQVCGKNLMNFMKEHMSVVPLNDQTSKYVIKGVHCEKIKLEAGIYIDNEFFDVPGFHCIDVRTIFRQLYPTAEKSSLNFFLAANKLGSKEDMPYQTMFKIYRMMRILMRHFNTHNYEEIIMHLDALCADRGNNYDLFGEMELNPFPLLDNTPFNLRNLNAAEIRELVTHGTDIVHYCNIDARRCHDLLRVRNIIMDRREMANLTFTSMFDALFRAGGMKVRNILMGYGYDPEWNLAFSTLGSGVKSDKKYPGAYVIPPKKGLYRDHVIVKRCRRANVAQTRGPANADVLEQIARGDDAYGLLNDDFDIQYPPSEGNDQNSSIDRPCSDIDFNALYPSITMAYNISPEKAIFSAKLHRELSKPGRLDQFGHPYRFIEVRFRYGLPTQADEDKELIEGWIIQHTPVEFIDERGKKNIKYEGMGILPHVLIMLGNFRSSVKKLMEVYLGPKEFLEKLFESTKLNILAQKSYSEQRDLLRETLNQELSARLAAHEANKKAYYAGRVKSFKEIIEFFEREFFRESSRIARTCESLTLGGLYEEIVFYYGYYNCKQNTIKVLMNSCYGETGNTLSPLFIPLVSGGITTYGQRSIKFIKTIVEQKKCSVKYGDTDSVYLSPPDSYFAQVDAQYIRGEITKLQYWSRMIEISMEFLDMLVIEIGELLYKDNGTRFLRVAYEKILWPYMFMGKKKYLGIAHMGIVNLSLCLTTCTLSEFMKSKLLLIKGMEIKKRGASDILKHICFEIIKEAFCVTCTKTLQEIVEDKLREIGTRQFPSELFVKSARYRLPGKKENGEQKRGNVTVLRFVERMREIEKKYPNTEIRAPEAGERFNYIVLRKYPWCFDMRGRKIDIKIGDKYEYFESLKNEEYKKIYRTENPDEPDMTIDIDYYISHEIIGQFARFLTYHPEYDKFYNISAAGGVEDDDLLDHAYKEADKKAHNFAKKKLREFYDARYAKQYESRGKIYQGNFRQINKIYKKSLEQQYGNIAAVFNPINTIITRGDETYTSMREGFIKNAKTRGKNSADTGILQLVRDKNLNPFALACKYTAKGGICDQRKLQYEASAKKILAEFDKLIPEFESITIKHMAVMQDIINKTRKESSVELDEDLILSHFAAHYLISDTNNEFTLVSKAWDVFNDLVGIYQSEYENELIHKELKFLKSRQVGAQIIPPSLQVDKKTTEEDLRSWLERNKDAEK